MVSLRQDDLRDCYIFNALPIRQKLRSNFPYSATAASFLSSFFSTSLSPMAKTVANYHNLVLDSEFGFFTQSAATSGRRGPWRTW